MIRRPPRSTQGVSSAASDVYKRQVSTSIPTRAACKSDSELAHSCNEWRVARLRGCAPLPRSSGSSPLPGGGYVITGGLGALGLQAAKIFFENGALCVTLASRTGRVVRDGQGLQAQMASLTPSPMLLAACDSACRLDTSPLMQLGGHLTCLLYTSPSPRDRTRSRMPSSA